MARRRTAGAISRAEYLNQAALRKEQARKLRFEGLTLRAIADEMGVSLGSVHGYLKD